MKPSTTVSGKPAKPKAISEKDRLWTLAAKAKVAKPKAPTRKERKDRAMKLYNRILAGPTFERFCLNELVHPNVGMREMDMVMNYLFDVYSKWMEETLDEYVAFTPELRDTELAERRKSAARRRNLRG